MSNDSRETTFEKEHALLLIYDMDRREALVQELGEDKAVEKLIKESDIFDDDETGLENGPDAAPLSEDAIARVVTRVIKRVEEEETKSF